MVRVCEENDSKRDRSEDRLKAERLDRFNVPAQGEEGKAEFDRHPANWGKERG